MIIILTNTTFLHPSSSSERGQAESLRSRPIAAVVPHQVQWLPVRSLLLGNVFHTFHRLCAVNLTFCLLSAQKGQLENAFAISTSFMHSYELLTTHGIMPLYQDLRDYMSGDKNKRAGRWAGLDLGCVTAAASCKLKAANLTCDINSIARQRAAHL